MKPVITFSRKPQCAQPPSVCAFLQRRGLCKSELDGGGVEGDANREQETERELHKGRKLVSEGVLVIMATHLSGKRSRCATDTSFHHMHASSLMLSEGHGRVLAASAHFFSSFLTVSSLLLLVFLKISFLVHWLFTSTSFLPPVSLTFFSLPPCTLPSASS